MSVLGYTEVRYVDTLYIGTYFTLVGCTTVYRVEDCDQYKHTVCRPVQYWCYQRCRYVDFANTESVVTYPVATACNVIG